MRLIDADKLHDWMSDDFCGMELIPLINALEVIEVAPTVNAVVLPCRVGDTVYVICGNRDISEFKVDLRFWNDTVGWMIRTEVCLFYEIDFGKRVFFTKEEAEARLEKMKDGVK